MNEARVDSLHQVGARELRLFSTHDVSCGCAFSLRSARSERLEVLDEIRTLSRGETEVQHTVVVRDDIGERSGAAIMEVWSVLEQSAKRCRAVGLFRRARSVARIHAGFIRLVQTSRVDVTEDGADVTRCAASCTGEDDASASSGRRIEGA